MGSKAPEFNWQILNWFNSVFFLVLFTLKVGIGHTVVEDWSWWFIFAPFWAPLLVAGIAFLIGVILVGIGGLLENK